MAVLEMEEGRMQVCRDGAPIYDIVLEDSFDRLPEEMERLGSQGRKLCIVTDSNVAPLYLEAVEKLLSGCFSQVTSYVFPAGEEHKNLDTVKRVYEHLIQNRFDRKDWLAALGGGITGDLCGFTAATYLRGVDFIQIPTTLLAQVDSSVGGKVAVDLQAGKNLAGAFYQPRMVLMDPDCLKTLPDRVFSDGMAEVIKYGCIWDRSLFDLLAALKNRQGIMAHIEDITLRCCDIKRQVVEQDEHDTGLRMLLNFGHTLGHVYEKAYHYETYTHGEAVAAGMVAAARIGSRLGVTPASAEAEITQLLRCYQLPTGISAAQPDYQETLVKDKKSQGKDINLIALTEIGHAEPVKTPQTRLLELVKECGL